MKLKPQPGREMNFSSFQPKHLQLFRWARNPKVRNILAAGGIRSGKTIALIVILLMRALAAPGSTHGIFLSTRTACKRNLFDGSFVEALEIVLPGWFETLKLSKENFVSVTDLTIKLPNGSKIMFLGLDKPERLRGLKFSTALLDEANLNPYQTVMTLRGRLSESVPMLDGSILHTLFLFSLNPTVKSSWDFQVFVEGLIPGDRTPIKNHKRAYKHLVINAIDNKANLPDSMFEQFEDMTEQQRRRDEFGMWSEDNPNALFRITSIKRTDAPRHEDGSYNLKEIVVTVDPAGTANKNSDRTGIIVAGADYEGNYYVLEDASTKSKPDEWIAKVVELRAKYDANWIITEKNYGQDILRELMYRLAPNEPLKFVDAHGRGKRLRAEPVAVLYERGLVSHPQSLRGLEAQMEEFDSPTFKGSPDAVDAMVYALTHLSGIKIGPSPVKQSTMQGYYRQYT